MKPNPFLKHFSAVLAAALLTLPLPAETFYVGVDDSGFSPPILNIEVGDTVIWVNKDEEDFPHTTTSTVTSPSPAPWDQLLVGVDDETLPITFNNVGTFTYHDKLAPGNSGSITVNAITTPVITLELPRVEGGKFRFEVAGLTPGKTNVVEYTTNFVQWTAVSTNVAAAASMSVTNDLSMGPKLFRVIQQP